MKKTYEAPKAEKIEFDYTDTIATSRPYDPNKTDEATTDWWTCQTRYVDVKDVAGDVCGYV